MSSDYDKRLKIIKMLKKHPKTKTDISYIIKLSDRWQFQTDEVKKKRLKTAGIRFLKIPNKIFDGWLHGTDNDQNFFVELLIANLDVYIELFEIANTLNYWKTETEIQESKEKIKDLIISIKSFIKPN